MTTDTKATNCNRRFVKWDGTIICKPAQIDIANTPPEVLLQLSRHLGPIKVSPEICAACDQTLTPIVKVLKETLPPHKEGRDRKFQVEPDGSIVYEPIDAEPPRDINGYKRDPDNPLRFISHWPPCQLRHYVGVRFAKCGCIDIITRCNNFNKPTYQNRVDLETCINCVNRSMV
jgi:hypothetical protein